MLRFPKDYPFFRGIQTRSSNTLRALLHLLYRIVSLYILRISVLRYKVSALHEKASFNIRSLPKAEERERDKYLVQTFTEFNLILYVRNKTLITSMNVARNYEVSFVSLNVKATQNFSLRWMLMSQYCEMFYHAM